MSDVNMDQLEKEAVATSDLDMNQPGFTVPINAVKNYIRRMAVESGLNCELVFSRVDHASGTKTLPDGRKRLIIGCKGMYDRSVTRLVLPGASLANGISSDRDPFEGQSSVKAESVRENGLLCRFTREDEAVWMVKRSKHELSHLRQETILFRSRSNGSDARVRSACIDRMCESALPEYYQGSYHVAAHEIVADTDGIRDSMSDLSAHCEDLGLSFPRCKVLMLDRLNREPQLYGELRGYDVGKNDFVAGRKWPNFAIRRHFESVDDVVTMLTEFDTENGKVNGLLVVDEKSDMYANLLPGECMLLTLAQTQAETRVRIMGMMMSHGMSHLFCKDYEAGFDAWPKAAQEAYIEREDPFGDRHDDYVRMAEEMSCGVVELDEHVKGDPLLRFGG